MKYSEVMCYETEKQKQLLLSANTAAALEYVEAWTVYPRVVRLPFLPRNSCSRQVYHGATDSALCSVRLASTSLFTD